MKPKIAEMTAADWPRVAAIYQMGLDGDQASFETEVPSFALWNERHLASGRLVAREEGLVVGWAALSPVSARPVYRGVAEVSIYVDPARRGRGVGRALLAALVAASEELGLWTLQASIFPENKASLALHLNAGFRELGRREKIGCHRGVWRDTVLLERRSARIGMD